MNDVVDVQYIDYELVKHIVFIISQKMTEETEVYYWHMLHQLPPLVGAPFWTGETGFQW